MIFQVAFTKVPNAVEQKSGVAEVILVPPTPISAENMPAAIAICAAQNAEVIKGLSTNLKVVAVPFGS